MDDSIKPDIPFLDISRVKNIIFKRKVHNNNTQHYTTTIEKC
jgi:hypothetical protein